MAHIQISDAARVHIAEMFNRLGAELVDPPLLLTLNWVRRATVKHPDGSVEDLGPGFHFGLHRRNNLKSVLLHKFDNHRDIGLHPQSEFESGTSLIDFVDGKLSLKIS